VNKKYKLDIFKTISNISKKDVGYYALLGDDEKKQFAPVVVMRWLTGTTNKAQIYYINELVNPYVFSLTKHNELIYKLMTICSPGKEYRYSWCNKKSKKTTKTPESINVICEFFGYSVLHAIDSLPLLSNSDIVSYAEQLGKQKTTITKIKKELKNR